jgi:hypothetical protein
VSPGSNPGGNRAGFTSSVDVGAASLRRPVRSARCFFLAPPRRASPIGGCQARPAALLVAGHPSGTTAMAGGREATGRLTCGSGRSPCRPSRPSSHASVDLSSQALPAAVQEQAHQRARRVRIWGDARRAVPSRAGRTGWCSSSRQAPRSSHGPHLEAPRRWLRWCRVSPPRMAVSEILASKLGPWSSCQKALRRAMSTQPLRPCPFGAYRASRRA